MKSPVLLFLGAFVSLVFFFLGISLVFLSVFCLFYRVSVRKSLMFLRFSLVFSKRPRKRRTGSIAIGPLSQRVSCVISFLVFPVGGPPLKTVTSLNKEARLREAPDTFNFLRHVVRAIWSVRAKCSHRCVSLKETSLKPVQILKRTTKNSAEQTVMRTK